MKVLLNRFKSKNSIDKDVSLNIELVSKQKLMEINDIEFLIDEYSQFSLERKNSVDYYLHGKISVFKDLGYGFEDVVDEEVTNLKESLILELVYPYNYDPLPNFKYAIIRKDSNKVDVTNTFDCKINDIIIGYNKTIKEVYTILGIEIFGDFKRITLDRAIIDKTHLIPSIANYKRYYKNIPIKYDIFKCGLSLNVMGDPMWLFKSSINLDLKDEFNFPISELFYKMNFKNIISDKMLNGVLDNTTDLLDIIEFDLNLISKKTLNSISSEFLVNNTKFKYDIFHKIDIRVYSDIIESGVTKLTGNLPGYSFNFGNGGSVWKDLLDIGVYQGFNGVDYPYLNGQHYMYKNIEIVFKRKIPLKLLGNLLPNDLNYKDNSEKIKNYC